MWNLAVSAIGLLKLVPISWMVFGGLFGVATLVVNNHFQERQRTEAALHLVIKEKDILIHNQQEQIAGYIVDKNNLIVSNNSLEIYIGSLQETINRIIEETKRIIESDGAFERRQAELDRLIADEVRQDRIAAVRESRKAQLLLNYINSNTQCWIVNFDKVDGTCVQGIWRPESNGPK